jgi:hypothetical protein
MVTHPLFSTAQPFPLCLHIEKLAAVFFRRDRARVVLSEGAVPIPCDQVVAPSSQPPGKHAQRGAQSSPSSAQFPQNRDGSVGPRRNPLFPQAAIPHYVHRVEVVGGSAVPSEDLCGKIALQGGETEAVLRIVLQHELNHPVAKTADAIVENDRIGAGDGHAALVSMLRHRRGALRKLPSRSALGHDGLVCLVGILRLRKPVRHCEPTRYAQDDQRGLNQRPLPGLRFISGTWSSTFPFSSR